MAAKKLTVKKKWALALATGAAVLGVGAPAYAVQVQVGGGTWNYGTDVDLAYVWSYYYHGSVCHGSSVRTHTLYRSPNTSAGQWARITAPERPYVADSSYWRHC